LADVVRRLTPSAEVFREGTVCGGATDTDNVRREVMGEFEIVLTPTPYVGGAANRMSDFFMRLIGFMAIGRVLRRRGVAPIIGDIERESYKAQLLTVSEAERLASGRQFMSAENQASLREQAVESCAEEYPEDFVYDFVESCPGDNFELGINYRACGFCKFAAVTETKKSYRTSAGSISRLMQHVAFAWSGQRRSPVVRATAIFASHNSSRNGTAACLLWVLSSGAPCAKGKGSRQGDAGQ
jgi:hypothetical protein